MQDFRASVLPGDLKHVQRHPCAQERRALQLIVSGWKTTRQNQLNTRNRAGPQRRRTGRFHVRVRILGRQIGATEHGAEAARLQTIEMNNQLRHIRPQVKLIVLKLGSAIIPGRDAFSGEDVFPGGIESGGAVVPGGRSGKSWRLFCSGSGGFCNRRRRVC
ncbi:hypothetical protein Efla_000532 [Eimeria flavescens]